MARNFLRLLFLVVLPSLAQAGEVLDSYQEQKISTRGIHDIKIVGVRGHLRLIGHAQGSQLALRVRHSASRKFEDWYLSVERRHNTLYLEVFSVAYGKQWRTQVKEELWPDFDLDLQGVSLPTSVGWREGEMEVKNWDAPLELSFLRGQARVEGGHGALVLQPVQANIQVLNHEGDIKLNGDSGQVQLFKTRGPVAINWMSGKISLQSCQGKLQIESREGDVSVNGGQGELSLQMTRGTVHVAAFNGNVNGRGEQAQWDLTETAPAHIHLINASGNVGLHWQSGGANVLLSSAHGPVDIVHSDFLSREFNDGQQVAKGVKLAKQMGQVFIRTESGAIHWRQ